MKIKFYLLVFSCVLFASSVRSQCMSQVSSCDPATGTATTYTFSPVDMATGTILTDPNLTDFIGPQVLIENAGCTEAGGLFDVVVSVEQLTTTAATYFKWSFKDGLLWHNGDKNRWYRFTMDFYEAGTTTPVSVNVLQEIGDIDGDCDYNNNGRDHGGCDNYDPDFNVNSDYVQVLNYDWFYYNDPTLIYHPSLAQHNYFLSAGVNNYSFSAISGVPANEATQAVVFAWLDRSSLTFDYFAGEFGGLALNLSTDFAIQNACLLLPVEFSDFEVSAINSNDVSVTWETASEFNGEEFQVEYSLDGVNFETLTSIECKEENKDGASYEYIHKGAGSLTGGSLYYRVRFLEYDGTSSTTEILSVDFNQQNKTTIRYNAQEKRIFVNGEKVSFVRVFDIAGNQVTSKELNPSSTENVLDVKELKPGVYVVTTNHNTSKIVVY